MSNFRKHPAEAHVQTKKLHDDDDDDESSLGAYDSNNCSRAYF